MFKCKETVALQLYKSIQYVMFAYFTGWSDTKWFLKQKSDVGDNSVPEKAPKRVVRKSDTEYIKFEFITAGSDPEHVCSMGWNPVEWGAKVIKALETLKYKAPEMWWEAKPISLRERDWL